MNLPAAQRPRLFAALASVVFAGVVLAGVAACGDDSGPATTAGPSAAQSGPGTISLTSSTIGRQSGRVLVASVAPQGGGAALARACIGIQSDRFAAPVTVMTDISADGNPCGAATPATKLPGGTYTLTAGIYAPPAQKAEVEISQTVRVNGDTAVQIDGAALTR